MLLMSVRRTKMSLMRYVSLVLKYKLDLGTDPKISHWKEGKLFSQRKSVKIKLVIHGSWRA